MNEIKLSIQQKNQLKQACVTHLRLNLPLVLVYKTPHPHTAHAIIKFHTNPPDFIPQDSIVKSPYSSSQFVKVYAYNPLMLKPISIAVFKPVSLRRSNNNYSYFSGVVFPTDYKYYKKFIHNEQFFPKFSYPVYYHDNQVKDNCENVYYFCRFSNCPNIVFPVNIQTLDAHKTLSQLATLVPDSIYKDIIKTLNLTVQNNKIVFYCYHNDSKEVRMHEITFDAVPFRVNVCSDISKFSNAAEFILASYYQHKKYLGDKNASS